jgi:hypothetical protein
MSSAVIYGLFDPESDHLRYVGKTTNIAKRYESHLYESAKRSRKPYSRRWIASLLARGLKPKMEVLDIVSSAVANDAERCWIASMRLAGCKLTNRTDGGDGQSKGYQWSAEARRKIGLAGRGKKRSDETKAKLRAAFSKPEEVAKRRARVEWLKQNNPDWLAKVRVGFSGRAHRKESIEKISASWTDERKAAHAAEKSALPFDDRWRKQLSAALAGRWERDRGKPISSEHKEALARGRKARWDAWRAAGKPRLNYSTRRKDTRFLECGGEKMTISEWSERTGIKRHTIEARIFKGGWSVELALTTPTGALHGSRLKKKSKTS